MTPIQKLRGVGPALAKILLANGVETVEALAAFEVAQLRSIPGIGTNRAASLKEAARTHTEDLQRAKAAPAGPKRVNGKPDAGRAAARTRTTQAEMDARLAEAEAARAAAEEKAARAEAKALKAKRKAASLAVEFAAAQVKAKQKAKKVKAKAKKAIEREKAKAKAILDGKYSQKGKAGQKKKKKAKK
ncbi:hypothetical protein RA19_20105 [Leisingera sp. ANG-M1]|uniref:helix-hairpin-helix domain-containing protein n=1 Tax=Leisingera sp. ANG-M1 TaxID=1577895 RepID=UPI00057FC686|nr:helix-hairpin-helix domain-containing protein [Leisingera sp. ANG-M1]KIC08280.1 hypothetical protein RA19_20105 [Leisingera sp. ANG-M1]